MQPEKTPDYPTRSPWAFVPILYFMEGLPYVVVTAMSTLMFKALALSRPELGIENDSITFWTTIIALPWTLKMLWGPMVDLTLTKRRWILLTQGLLLGGMAVLAWAIQLPNFYSVTLGVLTVMAFISATHDIAADGFYLLSMNKQKQAFFIGIKSTFYRLATIFGSGILVWVAGQLEKITRAPFTLVKEGATGSETTRQVPLNGFQEMLQRIDIAAEPFIQHDIARAWSLAILTGLLVYGVVYVLNILVLPKPPLDRRATDSGVDQATQLALPPDQPEPIPSHLPPAEREVKVPFVEAIASFFRQDRIFWILMFILFYRFGESLIGKISGLFLKDPIEKGGLGLDTDTIGLISGTWGVAALVAGGLLGGFVISKFGIKRSLWPMVLALNIPNLFYVWAASNHPGPDLVRWLIVVDQFGYGFGFAAYMVYLMFVSQGTRRYQTSNFAIATGLMALGVMLAGVVSGYLQVRMGYRDFFMMVVLLGIPGIITLFFIPMDKQDIHLAPAELE